MGHWHQRLAPVCDSREALLWCPCPHDIRSHPRRRRRRASSRRRHQRQLLRRRGAPRIVRHSIQIVRRNAIPIPRHQPGRIGRGAHRPRGGERRREVDANEVFSGVGESRFRHGFVRGKAGEFFCWRGSIGVRAFLGNIICVQHFGHITGWGFGWVVDVVCCPWLMIDGTIPLSQPTCSITLATPCSLAHYNCRFLKGGPLRRARARERSSPVLG